jgi:hypothetical protein
LAGSQLTPFITNKMAKTRGEYVGYEGGAQDPKLYLERWKDENGQD